MSDIKMRDVFKPESGKPIFGSVGKDVYQDIDHHMIDIVGRFESDEMAKAAAHAIGIHDQLQQENDELKATVNQLRNNARYCCDEEMLDELADIISISPEQCLLEHDKRVVFNYSRKYALDVDNGCPPYVLVHADSYISKLGGEK